VKTRSLVALLAALGAASLMGHFPWGP
jgi:hypothetical protein